RTRRAAVLLWFLPGTEGIQGRGAIGCQQRLDRLVGQVADRAVRVRRIEMAVPNPAQGHCGDQHRS
ncbi:MAG TPA: hypothetical protein VN044_06555, partial [Verrucomicrobiae bacterium]|nr:hypothetical protein [Verrucomicrobiae bacterium]